MTLFSKTLSNGSELEVKAEGDALLAYVDGKESARGSFFDGVYDVRRTPKMLPQMPVTPTGERTTYRLCGKFALTTAEGEALAAKVAELKRHRDAEATAALEAAVPGLTALEAAQRELREARDREGEEFEAMMDSGDGGSPYVAPAELAARVAELTAQHPRAALYLRAKAQDAGAHWADNTGKGAAGVEAMRLLREGASTEEAQAALAKRRTFTD